MESETNIIPLRNFVFEDQNQQVSYGETMKVIDGVECDVYTFDGDNSKDLGVIRVKPGSKTPLQKVLNGDRTVEGYISGKGQLTITRSDGQKQIYKVGDDPKQQLSVNIEIGDLMQWEGAPDSDLVVYEVCFPPYEDGRYENIE